MEIAMFYAFPNSDLISNFGRRPAISGKERKQTERTCSKWRETCQPWSNSKSKCCDPSSLVCKCNLWMQNCRCVNKLWGG
uniref:Agouti domain-containing protein n=1 Tax=Octopus bimaculoides TaxID=37653 RepID=A0A0L8HXQ3_OCTBM